MRTDAIIRDQIEILSSAEGFFNSAVMFSLLRLKIFRLIGDGERSVAELADHCGARPGPLSRLLRCAVTMRLLQSSDGHAFRLSSAAQRVLGDERSDAYMGDWIAFLTSLYPQFETLHEAVGSKGAGLHLTEEFQKTGGAAESFNRAMQSYARLRGKELADFLNPKGAQSLLDLGCGPGTYAFHLAKRHPELRVTLADLPQVLEETRRAAPLQELISDVAYLPIDILRDEIPGLFDLVLISNTLHMLGKSASRTLIKRCFSSVNTGGSLVVQAQFLGPNGLGKRWPAILDLIMLLCSEEGENHTVEETMEWMKEAGFEALEYEPMSLLNTNSYIRGYRPGERVE